MGNVRTGLRFQFQGHQNPSARCLDSLKSPSWPTGREEKFPERVGSQGEINRESQYKMEQQSNYTQLLSRSTAHRSLHTWDNRLRRCWVTDPHVHYRPMERHCSASTVRIKWTAHLFRHLTGAIARRTSPLVPAHRLGTFDQWQQCKFGKDTGFALGTKELVASCIIVLYIEPDVQRREGRRRDLQRGHCQNIISLSRACMLCMYLWYKSV